MRRLGGGSFLRYYSRNNEDFQSKMCSLPPLVAGEIVFGRQAIWGELINIMREPQTMMGPLAVREVIEGVELALRRKSSVIGLGALTAPATGGGLSLLRMLPKGVTLTNGNAYTAAAVRHDVVEISKLLGLNKRARVAVVGCTGSVGVAASHLLAREGFELILVGRSEKRAQHHLRNIVGDVTFAGSVAALHCAEIVVLLTSDPSAKLLPKHVRNGTAVIDCAQPANIRDPKIFRAKQVIVVEGGIVRIPNYSSSIDLGLPDARDTFACLAETYLFAREGIREHSVGRPTPELALRLEKIAERHGICPRPLHNTTEMVPPHSRIISQALVIPSSSCKAQRHER
jgi:fatty aldehyde-generating acyl-ACP reductase